jgi:hypothetical protein
MESYIYVKIYANKTYNYLKLGVNMNMKFTVIQWGCPYENEIYNYLMRVSVWITIILYGESVWLLGNGVSIDVNVLNI